MKTTLAMLCFLGTAITGFSQDKNFDLSKYKFPDYKRHEMELNFNSRGYNRDQSWEEPSIGGNATTEKGGWADSNSQSNLGLSYSFESVTRKAIDRIYSSISGSYTYSMQDNYRQKEKNFNPGFGWNFGGLKDYYLTEGKFFLEGFTNVGLSFSGTKKTIDEMVDLKNSQNSFNISIGVGGGFGRKEKVSDLWQAYYILENLRKQQSLARELNEDDIFEFARHASKLKNKRFFDFRLRKIAELKSLDSILHKQGLIKDADISYFTTLNDYWNFVEFPDRESGKVLKFWVSPEYWTSYYKSLNSSDVTSTTTYFKSNLSFESNKQLNLFWERIIKLELANVTLADQKKNNTIEEPKNLFRSAVSLNYGFFPNTRTGLHASIEYAGKEQSTSQPSGFQSKFWRNEVLVGIYGGYYISPQLQLYGNFSLSHSFEAYHNGDHKNINYNLGLSYAIF
ncbi:MAG: hypothetical protein JZU47_00605 [Prolixibacteraceae bacterium]|nr:hypothetical protein [Prolixibacteraceae bacterium]